MLEAGQVLGGVAAVFLIVAVGLWMKLFRGPALQRLDGRTPSTSPKLIFATRLLVCAFAMSAVAMILAVVGWFSV